MRSKLLHIVMFGAMAAAGASTLATAGEQALSFIGNPAPAGAHADQLVVVSDALRNVNIVGGSTVRFVAGDRSFVWTFQNGNAHVVPFDLARIAPAGFLNHRVMTYVSDNPLYTGQ